MRVVGAMILVILILLVGCSEHAEVKRPEFTVKELPGGKLLIDKDTGNRYIVSNYWFEDRELQTQATTK